MKEIEYFFGITKKPYAIVLSANNTQKQMENNIKGELVRSLKITQKMFFTLDQIMFSITKHPELSTKYIAFTVTLIDAMIDNYPQENIEEIIRKTEAVFYLTIKYKNMHPKKAFFLATQESRTTNDQYIHLAIEEVIIPELRCELEL